MIRFSEAISMIDTANSADPNSIVVAGQSRPSERVYGERMSAMLDTYAPDASEVLRLAARAQHICRWRIPRSDYPMDRSGYLRWRNELKRKHAEWTGEILARCGYGSETIARCGALLRKENLKGDADAQTLEDVACLVFLAHYANDFSLRHDDGKVVDILGKTWKKMSDRGRKAALALPHSDRMRPLLTLALSTVEQTR